MKITEEQRARLCEEYGKIEGRWLDDKRDGDKQRADARKHGFSQALYILLGQNQANEELQRAHVCSKAAKGAAA